MNWTQRYPKAQQPTLREISDFISNPLWGELCAWVEGSYSIEPKVEHSTCSGAPGWNVKYKKSGRALCTLYPDDGFFTALISISAKDMPEAELMLPACSQYLRDLFARTGIFNGARWLMICVTDVKVLDDVKQLLRLRVPPKPQKIM